MVLIAEFHCISVQTESQHDNLIPYPILKSFDPCQNDHKISSVKILTLVLLNKLSLPHPFLTVNQSDNSMLYVISIHKLNEKQCKSHLIWIYTVFKGNAYPGSVGQGLNI